MAVLLSSLTLGLILGLLALGVLVSFRVFSFPDITVEGSITLGGAVAAAMLTSGWHPATATAAAFFAGAAAGAATGILHAGFKINGLLAGILVTTSLYSINLHVMGKSNLPLSSTTTLATFAAEAAAVLNPGGGPLPIFGWQVNARDLVLLTASLAAAAVVGLLLHLFFLTHLGLAMRATGNNDQMVKAVGVGVGGMLTLGLMLANGLTALSGALLVQYQGFSDVQMGVGMVVWGLASVILGETLVGTRRLASLIVGVLLGSVLFRLMVAVALRAGLDPVDLKAATALFVLAALVAPPFFESMRRRSINHD
ncbi:MAG: ABC transporter permease [Planctomycetia bacterium]